MVVQRNQLGYFELKEKPSKENLKVYYSDKYYQNNNSTYQTNYTDLELKYMEMKLFQKKLIIEEYMSEISSREFLDIGCGEGFAMQYFMCAGMEVTGIDYSNHAVSRENPSIKNRVLQGDIVEKLKDFKKAEKKFDIVLLDNVLEHVLKPEELLKDIFSIMHTDGILFVEVPNDFSALQKELLENKFVESPYWIAIPDHINYFNRESLINISRFCGFKVLDFIGDYPIDLNLLNKRNNYIKNPDIGKVLHRERMQKEIFLFELSPESSLNIYRELGSMGLGRNISVILKKDEEFCDEVTIAKC